MKKLFITGIPASGKTYLGNRLAKEWGGICVSIDNVREKLAEDERYKKWVNFYLDKDEKEYYLSTSPDERWADLVAQSEGLWPAICEEIKKYDNGNQPVIFEGVNLLPHLMYRDFKEMPGIVLLGDTFENIFSRNKNDPRWGETEELQKLEAEAFFYDERPRYKTEAEKYGYGIFESGDEVILAVKF